MCLFLAVPWVGLGSVIVSFLAPMLYKLEYILKLKIKCVQKQQIILLHFECP